MLEPMERSLPVPTGGIVPRGVVLMGCVLVLAAGTGPSYALPVSVREVTLVVLSVEPLLVEAAGTRSLAARSLEVPAAGRATLDLDVEWPAPGTAAHLRLEATDEPRTSEGDPSVSLQATLAVPGTEPVRSARSLALPEGSTGLFEVAGIEDRHLVLALRAERVTRPVAVRGETVGAPVAFRLEVERQDGERNVPLETDDLSTFVGRGVEYAFRLGQGESTESLRLVLTPVRLDGGVVEVEAEVTGALPGTGAPLILSRKERLFITRGATSSVTVVAGQPPAGYRFRITPAF